MALKRYFSKRDFVITPEPRGKIKKSRRRPIFVVQKHHASRLHYDFRLEADGTLKSWAVPKGPSLDPQQKRLAVEVEDHPLDYAQFEGEIPAGQYGAGHVLIWDRGTWDPPPDVRAGLKKGHLDFELHGEKLKGKWTLIRLRQSESEKKNWLLFKQRDSEARTDYDIVTKSPGSVLDKKPKISATRTRRATAAATKTDPSTARSSANAPPPDFVKPQLAQLVKRPPEGFDWFHEIKFDGYRALCRITGRDIRFLTRSGLDWTDKYGSLKNEAKKIPTKNAMLDGEIVWIDDSGRPNFQGLQNSLEEKKTDNLVYYVFDLLHLNGQDLRDLPLRERKEILKSLIGHMDNSRILFSDHAIGRGAEILKKNCEFKLEGVVSKRVDSPYTSGRTPDWQKSKCSASQEIVIGGYTESDSAERPFAAILMGVYDGEKLRYIGKVGTGFSLKTLEDLHRKFKTLEQDESPFEINSPRSRSIHWLNPVLIAEVEFKTRTDENILRQSSFKGLRPDKNARSSDKIEEVAISHPNRLIYPATQTHKIDVVRYYDEISDLILPFLNDRPISIVRCQETSTKNCFFQKSTDESHLIGVESRPIQYKDKMGHALVVNSKKELISLIQAGALELHEWGARFSRIHNPDVIVIDLDPDSMELWNIVVATAHEIRGMLKRLHLESFVKVTGGKGLHIHVPIKPIYSWETIKDFSRSLMRVLEDKSPRLYTTNMNKGKRKHRIFLDYLRNGYGATAVTPYSLRAKEFPTVALPIEWSELTTSLLPTDFKLPDVLRLLKKRRDPWKNYWRLAQKIKILEQNPEFAMKGL